MKFNKKNHYSNLNIIIFYLTQKGLNKAYTNGKGFFIDGNKLYVAGTFGKSNIKSNINDIFSDIGLPLNLTRYSERYRDVSEVLDNIHIDTVISHSLGSSISSEYMKNHPNNNIKHLTTYGAPFVSMSNKIMTTTQA